MIKKKIYKFFKDKTEYDKLFFAGRANTLIWIISEYLKSKKNPTIILPSTLCVSPAVIFKNLGIKIIYVDIDYRTGLIREDLLIEKIKNFKIDAIFYVNLFGNVGKNSFLRYARKKGILLVQDLAQTFISYSKNKNKKFIFGDIIIISFGYSKIFDLNGGAILLAKNKNLYEKLKEIRLKKNSKNLDHVKNYYLHWYHNYFSCSRIINITHTKKFAKKLYVRPYNSKLDKKIFLSLKKLNKEELRRKKILSLYKKVFKNKKIKILNNDVSLLPWRFCFLVKKNRDKILKVLRDSKYDASSYYLALKNYKNSARLEDKIINLWLDNKINKRKIYGQYQIIKNLL